MTGRKNNGGLSGSSSSEIKAGSNEPEQQWGRGGDWLPDSFRKGRGDHLSSAYKAQDSAPST